MYFSALYLDPAITTHRASVLTKPGLMLLCNFSNQARSYIYSTESLTRLNSVNYVACQHYSNTACKTWYNSFCI